MVRVRAIVRRREYFSIAPEVMAAQGEVHPYLSEQRETAINVHPYLSGREGAEDPRGIRESALVGRGAARASATFL
jgi:hypothetical protein